MPPIMPPYPARSHHQLELLLRVRQPLVQPGGIGPHPHGLLVREELHQAEEAAAVEGTVRFHLCPIQRETRGLPEFIQVYENRWLFTGVQESPPP